MDEFSYLSVLLSTSLGLPWRQIPAGFRDLSQSHSRNNDSVTASAGLECESFT